MAELQTTHQTAHGQQLDTLTTPVGTVDLSRYTLATYMRIVTYKTAFYSFHLPVACGLVVGGRATPEALAASKEICLQMGQYFQVCGTPRPHSPVPELQRVQCSTRGVDALRCRLALVWGRRLHS